MHKITTVSLLFLAGLACAMPKTVQEANEAFPAREAKVLKWFNDTKLNPAAGWNDFGDWKTHAGTWTLRKMAAGLRAIETGQAFRPDAATFPGTVAAWLDANAYQYASVGTDPGGGDGDYDMVFTQMTSLMYAFKDRPDLLTNTAVHSMIMKYNRPPRGVQRTLIMYFDGQDVNGHMQKTIFDIPGFFQIFFSPDLPPVKSPETENHLLMILSSKYLINQWMQRNYRGDPEVTRLFNSAKHVNQGGPLEDMLLQCLGRIVKNGLFESNGRPYQAYTLLPILNLYSYADQTTPGGRKLRVAAEAALNYQTMQFAMQSLESKRFGPSRRNIDYRRTLGIYENDYLPAMMGMLSGGYTSSDASLCTEDCLLPSKQNAGFALWTMLAKYRLPPAIHDFYLRKDNHNTGYGIWSRMESKYTSKHYRLNTNPVYLPGGLIPSPNLDAEPVMPSPEFYFLSEKFQNTSGGDYNHYPSFDFGSYSSTVYDRFAKPSSVLFSGDKAKSWSYPGHEVPDPIAEMGKDVMIMKGSSKVTVNSPLWWESKDFFSSHNLGVYKNVAFGYSGVTRQVSPPVGDIYGLWVTSPTKWPMTFPDAWTPSYEFDAPFNSKWSVRIFDLTSSNDVQNPRNGEKNPDKGAYVVAVSYQPSTNHDGYWGFWEVVPESNYPSIGNSRGVDYVYSQFFANSVNPKFNQYRTLVSKELLELDYAYGIDVAGFSGYSANAFSAIDGSANKALEYTNSDDMHLIESFQVDENFNFTGVKYIDGENGLITINNPHLGTTITMDSRDWKNPVITTTVKPIDMSPIITYILN